MQDVPQQSPDDLPLRLQQVLEALQSGQHDHEIAESLGISVHAVRAHIQRLLKRHGVNNRALLLSKTMLPMQDATCALDRAGVDSGTLRTTADRIRLWSGRLAMLALAAICGSVLAVIAAMNQPAPSDAYASQPMSGLVIPEDHAWPRPREWPEQAPWPPVLMEVALTKQGVYRREGCELLSQEADIAWTLVVPADATPCPHCRPPMYDRMTGFVMDDGVRVATEPTKPLSGPFSFGPVATKGHP